jgi:hypothetical protein
MLATPDGMFSFGAQCTGTDCPTAEQHVVVNGTTLPNNVAGFCMRASAAAPYLMDAYNEWYQWNGTTFATAAAPAGGTCGTSPYSADGSTLSTPGSGTLVTALGTWSLGTTTCGSAYKTLLNGSQAGGGCGNELLVANDGNMYAADATGNWWEWVNGGWTNLNTTTTP